MIDNVEKTGYTNLWEATSENTVTSSTKSCDTVATRYEYGDVDWTDANNIKLDDGNVAQCVCVGQTTYGLEASKFAFNIPSGSVITGVEVKVKAENLFEVNPVNISVMLTPFLNTAKTFTLTGDMETHTVGGDGELWGETITSSDVNKSGLGEFDNMTLDFGAVIFSNSPAITSVIQVDYVEMKVYYEVPTVSIWGDDLIWSEYPKFTKINNIEK
jgi:hypothetical protein